MRVNVTWDQEDAAIALAARPPVPLIPRDKWLAAMAPAALRVAAGLTLEAFGAGIGVPSSQIWKWETGQHVPKGAAGDRYCRVIAGLARHMEVTEDE